VGCAVLEHNLTASSKDPRDLRKKLENVLKVQMDADLEAGKVPFSSLSPTPCRFWTMFQNAEPWASMPSKASAGE